MNLIDSVNLSVLFTAVIFFTVLSGVLIVAYKKYKKEKKNIVKFFIFTFGAAAAVSMEYAINIGLRGLMVYHIALITAVFAFFLIIIFPLWKKSERKLLYVLTFFSTMSIGTFALKTLTPNLFVEFIHLILVLIIVLLVGILVIKFIISISK